MGLRIPRPSRRNQHGLLNTPDLGRIWTWFRLLGASAAFLAGVVLGIRWDWEGAVVAALMAGIVAADAVWRLRNSGLSTIFAMALDVTMIGLGMVAVSLSPVGVGAPLIYMLVVPPLMLSLRSAWLVMVYAAGWAAIAVFGVDVFPVPPEASEEVVTVIAYVLFATLTVAIVIVVAWTLDRTNRARSEFLASVSHEIRTPLTSIVGWSEMLVNDKDDLQTEDFIGGIRLIESEAGELSYIVDDLLTAARIDTGAITVTSERVDLGSVVDDVLPTTVPGFVEIVKRPLDHPVVMADPWRVRQILRNLLTNAYRYGGERVWIELGIDLGTCSLAVFDDGDGVDPALARRLFEPYVRGGIARGTQPPIGLGLSVSRSLARLMEGELEYRRIAGTTAFILELPRAPIGADAPRMPNTRPLEDHEVSRS
ncbi:MAG: HAMP domain-containing sensor histidine kinase [Acidimicrobiia bacterium]|nr:HAMP domain-containing sensor histidine kinase [Acidimicrobiia bacterium]